MTVSVYLLDDHEIVRRGLRELIETTEDLVVVGESGLAKEAVRRVPALRPDVAIFDARLTDGSGIDACREIRSIDPSIKGLILTSFDDEQALASAILAGASGFLLKDIRGNGIIDAVRRVAAGENLLDTRDARRLLQRWTADAGADPLMRALSPQERRVLELIADGLTNRQIGRRLSLAEKTVKNYVTSVLAKLGLESRTQAAVYVTTHGAQTRRRPPI
ncbi:Transcriptional regulatory protein devR (dosR) [Nostocoides japonicum T1-X7]|uniref:Transcriptional regulatory protein devR (DosR) n=1 Tax=Nostocoides japonicum T1-X7 TaxID=1194083 RepID=A0A077M4M4_9MICO|nr:response regulator transcription factor [Tetrasphaera japonica]CCH79069.1 Transcriptional regulatory protein devR (dosR) [Tetrasphaera japonica T1-X7]